MALTMLVADDSSTIQKVIKIALSKYSVQIAEASSLIEALSEIGRHRFDLLIVDASLPGAKSAADFRKMREGAGNVPMLLLVGSYENVDEAAFRDAGLEGFVKKPFESRDIVERVDELLHGGLRKTGQGRAAPTSSETRESPPRQVERNPERDEPAAEPVDHGFVATPEFDDDADHAVPPPPVSAPGAASSRVAPAGDGSGGMRPLTDQSRKGRPAFHDDEDDSDFEHSDVLPLPLDDDYETPAKEERTKPAEPLRQRDSQTRHATTTYIPPSVGLDEWDEMQRKRRADAKPDQFGFEPTEKMAPRDQQSSPPPKPPGRTTVESPEPAAAEPESRGDERFAAFGADFANEDKIMKMLELIVAEKLLPLVVQAVQDYCSEHFDELARETLTEEIRRLADEKARHLVDN